MNEHLVTDRIELPDHAPTAQGSVSATACRQADAAANVGAESALLDRLLGMAHDYRRAGHLNQAMELYWSLLEDYPETRHAQCASTSLLEMAQGYERTGAMHRARAIYTRLL